MPPPTAPQPLAPGKDAGAAKRADPPSSSSRKPAVSVYRDTDDTDETEDGGAPAADANGPDEYEYGPPDAAWYERRKREREAEREREEEEFLAEAAGEAPSSRSVFEPKSQRRDSGSAELTSLDLLLNADDGTDYEQEPLDRVKDMYLAAEAVSDTDLDRRFEELLERQRKLIGAYFKKSRPLIPNGSGDTRVGVSGDRQGQP